MATGANFEVTIDSTAVVDLVRRFRREGGKLTPTMRVVAEMLVSGVSDRYDSEGDGEWPPHAPGTFPHQLMQLTGRLAGSTDGKSGEYFAEASTNVEYVVYHLGGGRLPKRNPFELRDEVFDDVAEFIATSIAKQLSS